MLDSYVLIIFIKEMDRWKDALSKLRLLVAKQEV